LCPFDISKPSIELTQWLTGRMAGGTFRVADVNDVIFNTLGAAVGYVLFVGGVNEFGGGVCHGAGGEIKIGMA